MSTLQQVSTDRQIPQAVLRLINRFVQPVHTLVRVVRVGKPCGVGDKRLNLFFVPVVSSMQGQSSRTKFWQQQEQTYQTGSQYKKIVCNLLIWPSSHSNCPSRSTMGTASSSGSASRYTSTTKGNSVQPPEAAARVLWSDVGEGITKVSPVVWSCINLDGNWISSQ